MTNEQALKRMTEMMDLRGFAPSTQRTYLMHLRHLTNHFSTPFCDMGYDHVKDFLVHAINIRKLSCEYVNSAYSSIRFLYETVFERDWNMRHIPRVKKKRKFPEVLSKEDINKLFNAVSNVKHKAMLVVAYSAGLRVNEVAKLKITDIDSKNMQIFIRQAKGNKDRYALLSNTTLELLRKYYKLYHPKEWLFPGQNPNYPISTRTIQAAFNDAKKIAGINQRATPHTLRHSFATHLIEQGTNLLTVKDLLGHESVDTTAMYIHLARRDVLGVRSPFDGGDFNV